MEDGGCAMADVQWRMCDGGCAMSDVQWRMCNGGFVYINRNPTSDIL